MKTLISLILLTSLAVSGYLVFAGTKMTKTEKSRVIDYKSISSVIDHSNLKYPRQIGDDDCPFRLKVQHTGSFDFTYWNPDFDQVSIKVYDVIGNLLIEEMSDQSQIIRTYDLSESQSKLYVVKVSTAKRSFVTKVVTG